jgi:DNA-binding transcriptional LysR family regulator
MELVHLECFAALGDELHFGRAAERLHMRTPSLSKRISDLEATLGVRLFERTSRQVRLTPEGGALLVQARRALAEVRTLRAMASEAAAGTIGTVRAAYSPGTGELTTMLFRELRHRLPGVVVRPVQMVSREVAAAVRSGSVEVGIARVPPGPDLMTMVLTESPLTVVSMPAGHVLAERVRLCMDDLAGQTLIVASQAVTGGFPRIPNARFLEADVTSEGELFDLVSSGFGLHLTTEGAARRNRRRDIVERPLTGSTEYARELLMWRPDNDSPVVGTIRQVANEIRSEMDSVMLGEAR